MKGVKKLSITLVDIRQIALKVSLCLRKIQLQSITLADIQIAI